MEHHGDNMLILTRRVRESIVIGDNQYRITILGFKGNQVRVGITAPPNVPVHREEVYNRIERERETEGLPELVITGGPRHE